MTNEKQGTAEWLRGIIDGACGKGTYPMCYEIAKPFFGIECMKTRSCGSCILTMFTAIADRIDAERALPEGIEWPRFEDGELVKVGDTVGSDELFTVEGIAFEPERWTIKARSGSAYSYFHGAFGEPVKRPTPKVLGADGAPINVGDTVYCDDDSEQLIVDSFDDPGCVYITLAKSPDGILYTIEPSRLSHKRPDSWKRLLEDLDKGAVAAECSAELYCCDYFGADDCEACPASEVPFLCGKASFKDVADRIRALRGEVE